MRILRPSRVIRHQRMTALGSWMEVLPPTLCHGQWEQSAHAKTAPEKLKMCATRLRVLRQKKYAQSMDNVRLRPALIAETRLVEPPTRPNVYAKTRPIPSRTSVRSIPTNATLLVHVLRVAGD